MTDWKHPYPDFQIYEHWSMARRNWDPKHVILSRWLRRWVEDKRIAWSSLREKKQLTVQQFIELLMCLATDDVPRDQLVDYIRNFEPHSRNAGRQKPSKLAFPLSEIVSEDPPVENPLKEEQPHASEDKAGRDPHGRPTPSRGRTPDDSW